MTDPSGACFCSDNAVDWLDDAVSNTDGTVALVTGDETDATA